MAYTFTQTAEPALAVGFVATNYRHHHHMHMRKGRITLERPPRWTAGRTLGEVHIPRSLE
jgi:hypothetical protein